MFDGAEHLDLRGLKCPLPALMARRVLINAAPGTVLLVICDDPLSHLDLPHMARQEGFTVLSEAHEGGIYRAHLQRR
ncbi:tRNA 2-thiouridine synthesizing protein A [Rhizomicrobium palustre]|uniref:tRNA 2-thiouridine synthesizing protein A n=1 Tax=Rhizomicrobium palustre TaxID=189966 RepID=A0A846MY25_9PROT|nr:sulfurtransferase TusA family protein [Rhizomicrobium palustre]NIK88296.1 tRNA 2-thiouridine synthesizing protein A [Rhizomicrobium palustre]